MQTVKFTFYLVIGSASLTTIAIEPFRFLCTAAVEDDDKDGLPDRQFSAKCAYIIICISSML